MANCMTCRHNDKKAKYCPVKKAHTDLGYVLNCIAWAPTDEAEMKRFRAENAKLRELAHDLLQPILADGFDCYGCVHEDCNGMQYTDRCRLLDQARELGVEVDG